MWNKTCDDAFEGINSILIDDPVLSFPNFEKQFKLIVYASDIGIGVALLQDDDEKIEKNIGLLLKKIK